MSLPKTTPAWVVEASNADKPGWENLKFVKDYPVPELGENDCLVQIQAVSLNYRDLVIPKGQYPLPLNLPTVACSDGAGRILAVGSKVTQFEEGDKVVTQFTQKHQHGEPTPDMFDSALGGGAPGTLRQYAVFPAWGLARAPSNLSPTEAGTLTCAPLTSWNALFGLQSKAVQPGDVVLTQGTGGVSLSAIQFAKTAGATVIATTSSDDKAKRLEKLGADIVINYKTDPNWGETAKRLSPGKAGVDHVIEVGGPGTMAQSLKAIKLGGVISVIGFLGGAGHEKEPSTLEALTAGCIIRGVLIGSKAQLVAMNRAIDANNIHPVVDEKIFSLDNALDAFEYQWQQKNFGKVVIQLAGPVLGEKEG
ncbi:alcohol dehydrogenase [Cladophialophora yegresii CBS 114405]|uniref:Alcohol dehydrogenase n=1 Tax=Cladophialophora yegresii CBS 114405 TaxID=1182544 RepID=W9W9C7_9EURO|nr:alcohol dehydrogenase [Cladophialophora yegresii CBS 114405]EXJ64717.1 alcohol dehydrogenase [Cladophialophora yegresii CBS 114405]